MSSLMLAALLATGTVQPTDTTFSAAGVAALRLENVTGTTVVRTWNRDQIRVQAAHDNSVRIEITREGGAVEIETERTGRVGRDGGTSVNYEIHVPARLALDIEGVNHTVRIDGSRGRVDVETVNGDIDVRGGSGQLNLETVQGRITVDGASGSVNAETVNQSIRITNVSGDINAETVNGSITLSDVRSRRVDASTVNGPVSFSGPIANDGHYVLASHNGDIGFAMPAGSSATFTVSTFNGEFDVEFPVQVRDREARGRFEFQVGGGSAHIELESFGGNVSVRRTR